MPTIKPIPPGSCHHRRWCKAIVDAVGLHDETCPTAVLALSDEQVDAFAAECVTAKNHPSKEGLYITTVYYGRYDGRTASISGYDEATSKRWLAENLLMCAREANEAKKYEDPS